MKQLADCVQEWFGNPVTDMVEGLKMTTKEQERKNQERIARLHKVLRETHANEIWHEHSVITMIIILAALLSCF